MNSIRRFFHRREMTTEEELIQIHKMSVKRAEKKIAALWVLFERTPTGLKGELGDRIHGFNDTLRVYRNPTQFSRISRQECINQLFSLHDSMDAIKEAVETVKLSIIDTWIQNRRERRDRARKLKEEQEAVRQRFNGQRIHIH